MEYNGTDGIRFTTLEASTCEKMKGSCTSRKGVSGQAGRQEGKGSGRDDEKRNRDKYDPA